MKIKRNQKGIIYSMSSNFTILNFLIFCTGCQNVLAMNTLKITLLYFFFMNNTRIIKEKFPFVFSLEK